MENKKDRTKKIKGLEQEGIKRKLQQPPARKKKAGRWEKREVRGEKREVRGKKREVRGEKREVRGEKREVRGKKISRKKQPSNLPSLRERSDTPKYAAPGALGGRDWDHRRPTCFATEHPFSFGEHGNRRTCC